MTTLTPHPDQTLAVVRSPEAAGDPTIYSYRGARLTAWKADVILTLAGHPYDGKHFGNVGHTQQIIDWWIDKGGMPPGYVWPVPEKKTG